MSGEDLAEAMARHHPDVRYIAEVDDALPHIRAELGPGDIFLSMGAGNNWVLSHRLYEGAAA
jgi:UDP-N-acetylmuramate--alanine ligase